jgi:hypothetical protein
MSGTYQGVLFFGFDKDVKITRETGHTMKHEGIATYDNVVNPALV